mmetsp:Transcript_55642/g.146848  ORF Transcript_55642/g.146848 Transcript_55642/m.146848 type:complete len:210 (-) Transcript_55642:1295-1924(-)
MASSLDATLTSSPIIPHSIRCLEPTLPCNTVPALIPMRACSWGSPRDAHITRSCARRACWASADSHAAEPWSSSSMGEFQKAITASPMYLPTVPPVCTDRRRGSVRVAGSHDDGLRHGVEVFGEEGHQRAGIQVVACTARVIRIAEHDGHVARLDTEMRHLLSIVHHPHHRVWHIDVECLQVFRHQSKAVSYLCNLDKCARPRDRLSIM